MKKRCRDDGAKVRGGGERNGGREEGKLGIIKERRKGQGSRIMGRLGFVPCVTAVRFED